MIRFITVPIFALIAAPVFADADLNRRTDLISADLNISEQVFKTCFLDVQPDGEGLKPSPFSRSITNKRSASLMSFMECLPVTASCRARRASASMPSWRQPT